MAERPPQKRSSKPYKEYSPEEEALLYNPGAQAPVHYPPVSLPGSFDTSPSSVDSQLQVPSMLDSPGPWSNIKKSLGIRRVETARRIQVGLDFGTSATKVMFREVGNVGESRTRLFNFNHGVAGYPAFCLPSIVSFDKRGHLLLGAEAGKRVAALGWGAGLSRLKMLVAGRADPRYLDEAWNTRFNEHVKMALGDEARCTPDALAATFLAAVMRRIRRQLQVEFKSKSLDIAFNTCVPVDQSERTPVVLAFERILAVAGEMERLDADDPRAWLDHALRRLPEVRYEIEDDAQRVFLMPEAVASAAGYVSSIGRRTGLHAIVDIGAGTTDVSICRLSVGKRTGATTEWYAARSIPMGAARIEGLVARALYEAGHQADQVTLLKALSGDQLYSAISHKIVEGELIRMRNGTNRAWGDAFGRERQESAWRNTVTVFLAGGGAQIDGARTVFAESWQRGWGPYECGPIPEPESFDRKSGVPFHRVSVAFGLAIPLPELGGHILPSKASDHTPPKAPVRDWKQGGDQLLPRWGWT